MITQVVAAHLDLYLFQSWRWLPTSELRPEAEYELLD
jgi:hypothetical protein